MSLSTNPATAHIGRYFLDIRDQSNPTQDPRGYQMTTRITDDPVGFIREATAEGLRQGILVTFEDETGEGLEA